jgi:hypothetical protein
MEAKSEVKALDSIVHNFFEAGSNENGFFCVKQENVMH